MERGHHILGESCFDHQEETPILQQEDCRYFHATEGSPIHQNLRGFVRCNFPFLALLRSRREEFVSRMLLHKGRSNVNTRPHITVFEFLLYIWFAAFSYNELSEFLDTKSIFYAVDIWNACDIIIIVLGFAFLMARGLGIYQGNPQTIDAAFDILSLEALFMVPRLFSIMCLLPYFGTLLPCLEAMVKDFVKFMMLVVILYLGFLATFTLLARGAFSVPEMSWFLVRVFFGGSSLGFEIMRDINPKLGPPLMVIFVCMTNVLLITSLICIQRDAFARVIAHAREEYLFVYSVYVLEASTSKRLTHFYPPLVSLNPLNNKRF